MVQGKFQDYPMIVFNKVKVQNNKRLNHTRGEESQKKQWLSEFERMKRIIYNTLQLKSASTIAKKNQLSPFQINIIHLNDDVAAKLSAWKIMFPQSRSLVVIIIPFQSQSFFI